ncbi:glutathione peroxidase [Beggiatoa alba B18LD]|uniref:Glutathione peroxidase n=1 Tax=Beggiatoa alba B18LD TaxID=395493 RepID=I3CBW6_9GAMM|nr:glutathione peroxidase [Beggiatoa alba]EIJ41109.1 glutathione peroxidase [Beggiatoa alba B18LD]
MTDFYSLKAKAINGKEIEMSAYKGKVLLIVNTASKCGFTPQYEALQKLYEAYNPQGLEILGFPCDQFAHQEPHSDTEIQQFCSLNFGVTFQLFSKIDVNGENTHPIYQYLKQALSGILGSRIKWNFTKFLLAADGTPIKRFAPTTNPKDIAKYITPLLKTKPENPAP